MTHVSTISKPYFSGGGLPLPVEGPSLVYVLRIVQTNSYFNWSN